MQPNEKTGKRLDFIVECRTKEEANDVDLTVYRFHRYSETRDVYIFVLRRAYV